MESAAETSQAEFVIDAAVICDEGDLGHLRRVVIDPIARAITHLVVEPHHRRGSGRLDPVDLVASASGSEIGLRCSPLGFAALEAAEDIHFYPGGSGAWNYEQSQMLTSPFYPLWMGMGSRRAISALHAVTTDRVPTAEVGVRRGERVAATDGPIGHVQGLVVDASDHCVTHILLDEGHLWGRKRVAIPIGAVIRVDEGVRLSISRKDVEDLSGVTLDDRR